jgi:hypothetical protein
MSKILTYEGNIYNDLVTSYHFVEFKTIESSLYGNKLFYDSQIYMENKY